ncbi:MAG: phosphoribosyltransferase family protein [Flavobacteriales bacterium]|nr:phosphoribosyltransferase family protein [Flavobacteriales bacterium]
MSNSEQPTVILDAARIRRSVQRIARQIHEDHHLSDHLVIVGIDGQGTVLADRIASELISITKGNVRSLVLSLHKDDPLNHAISLSEDGATLEGAAVVVVDDVLNSGRTLLYGVRHLLGFSPRSVAACVLVDRIHRRFPIRADYVGKSLSTTFKSHITVRLAGGNKDVALLS